MSDANFPPPGDQPGRYRLRPVRESDLDALAQLTQARAIGISSLPAQRQGLRESVEHSLASFASADDASGEETYLFVLEDRGRDDGQGGAPLIGTAGIAAAAGFNDRFYSYRNEFIVQASPALGARNRIHTLHLCHDLTGVTLLTGFHIDAAYAGTLAPQLLSRGRLAYIARFPERFSDRIAAENPGLADDSGRCPFWDAVGRRFFDVDYPTAEQLSGGRSPKGYLAELMPQSPIYVPLLPEAAQWALGQLHPVGELPFRILLDEGLDGDSYLNLFDGGPTAEGRVALLKTVQRLRRLRLDARARAAVSGPWHLVCSGEGSVFAATLLPWPLAAAAPGVEPQTLLAELLGWQPGQVLMGAHLDVDVEGSTAATVGAVSAPARGGNA